MADTLRMLKGRSEHARILGGNSIGLKNRQNLAPKGFLKGTLVINIILNHLLVKVFAHDWFIEPGSLFELALLHEEYVRYVKFPNVTLIAGNVQFIEGTQRNSTQLS